MSLTNVLTGIPALSGPVAKEVIGLHRGQWAKLLYFIGGSMNLFIMKNNRIFRIIDISQTDIQYIQILLHEYSSA